ncbi:MAG: ribosome biogenesis factor YjgA [Ilumatobacteraceae bacterium]
MRGRDPDTGEFREASRTQQRREALDVLVLAHALAERSDAQLASLPLPKDLRPHIDQVRRISAHGARKRELAFLAKQLRREDEATLDAIRAAMNAEGEGVRRETAMLHNVEDWRRRLLEHGDTALGELLTEHPQADRQQLRQLLRNAVEEQKRGSPPHAYRELFRVLREVLAAPMDESP